MYPSPSQPPDRSSAAAPGEPADVPLLMDQFLPRYDLAVAHAHVFRAPPAECYRAASDLDLFRAPLIRTLLEVRGLPQRLAGTLKRPGDATAPEVSRATFRLKDLAALGWTQLGEVPGSQLVMGQVCRPWKPVATSTGSPVSPQQFVDFDRPGSAKIATGLRVDPYGSGSSILTMETRVASTDDESRRRFRRYWLFVGPFSALIHGMAMRLLAAELRRPIPGRPRDPAGAA